MCGRAGARMAVFSLEDTRGSHPSLDVFRLWPGDAVHPAPGAGGTQPRGPCTFLCLQKSVTQSNLSCLPSMRSDIKKNKASHMVSFN